MSQRCVLHAFIYCRYITAISDHYSTFAIAPLNWTQKHVRFSDQIKHDLVEHYLNIHVFRIQEVRILVPIQIIYLIPIRYL